MGLLEPSGQLGFELMERAKPVTRGDLKKLIQSIDHLRGISFLTEPEQTESLDSLFAEVRGKEKTNPGQGHLQ